MNRVQKKCLWVSTAAHGLLLLLMVAGSGFLAARRQTESLPVLTMVPDRLVDEALAGGGGDPQGIQEAAAPIVPPPASTPQPPPLPPPQSTPKPAVKQPEPQPEAPAPKPIPEKAPAEPDFKEPKKIPKPAKPTVQQTRPADTSPPKKPPVKKTPIALDERALKPTVRAPSKEAAQKSLAAAEARARQAEDARRQRINGTVSSLQAKLSSGGVSAAMPFGPGGESYANYGLFVVTRFDRAWRAPEEVSDDSATVKAKVVIARDGRVISATIVGRSGVSALDKSVQAALDRVDSIGKSFPDGTTDEQRTFFINFNLKAKRALG